jgi:hypothetical protein
MIGGLLEKHADQFVGRFEDGCAHEDFQFGDSGSGGLFALEGCNQVLDFGFLCEGDKWVWRFFFLPSRRCSRERALSA